MTASSRPAITATVRKAPHGIIIVAFTGLMTLRSSPQVSRMTDKCLTEADRGVVVDAAHLTVSSAVMLTLFPALARAHAMPLALARPSRVVRRYLSTGILRSVTVHDSIQSACHYLDSEWQPVRRELRLPAEPTSPATARSFVRAACADWHLDHMLEPALVVTSELVTNAVEHAGTSLLLTVGLRREFLFISVEDYRRDIHVPPRPAALDPSAGSGRGLFLIDLYATSRGVTDTRTGKRVWASLRAVPVGAPTISRSPPGPHG